MSQKLKLLEKVDIFRSLDNSAKNRLESMIEKREICAGENLALQGGQALSFFILISGTVMLFTKKEKAVVFSEPGDFIGLELLSSNGEYDNSLRALTDGEIFLLNRNKFIEMIQEDSLMEENIMILWKSYFSKTAPFIEEPDETEVESIN